jgi:polysaccharide export outer membrane protein
VFVAGRTPEQIRADLQARAREFYEDADVSLRVTDYRSKKIFVFGEVQVPGAYEYNGANTVLGTLARAQPNRLADPSRVQVLRPNADGELVARMTVDLDKMVKDGDTALDAVLEEGDIIYVPPTTLAAIGLAFQQLLLPIQPAASVVAGPVDIYDSGQQKPYSSGNGSQ